MPAVLHEQPSPAARSSPHCCVLLRPTLLSAKSLNRSAAPLPSPHQAPCSCRRSPAPRSTPSSPPRRPSPAPSPPLSRPPLALHGHEILPCLLAMPSLLTFMDAPAACCSTCPIELLGLCSCPVTAVVCLLKQCRLPRLRVHHVWAEPHQVVASCSCDVLRERIRNRIGTSSAKYPEDPVIVKFHLDKCTSTSWTAKYMDTLSPASNVYDYTR